MAHVFYFLVSGLPLHYHYAQKGDTFSTGATQKSRTWTSSLPGDSWASLKERLKRISKTRHAQRLHTHEALSNNQVPLLGVPSIRIRVYWGLLWAPDFGKSHISDTSTLKYTCRQHFEANVYHVGVHGPSGVHLLRVVQHGVFQNLVLQPLPSWS